MKFLYSIGIFIYGGLLRLAAIFNEKAGLLVHGRANTIRIWELENQQSNTKKRIWFHCSSLGEFEMIIPLIDKIDRSEFHVAVSFYSPSGYENASSNPKIDTAFYLPLDMRYKMKDLIQLVNPAAFILVKYDFWFHLLDILNKQGIPTYLVNGRFTKNHFVFRPMMIWAKQIIAQMSWLYVQLPSDQSNLLNHGINNVSTVKDLRFQQAKNRKDSCQPNTVINRFCENKPTLILGSSWPIEERLLAESLPIDNYKIIIAPHDVSSGHIQSIKKLLNEKSSFSCWSDKNINFDAHVLILDTIGQLANAYQYATVAFIGGGFSGKLHNTLEAAAYGIPVLCGPKVSSFPEAEILQKHNLLYRIKNSDDLNRHLQQALKPEMLEKSTLGMKTLFTNEEPKITKMVNQLLSSSVKI